MLDIDPFKLQVYGKKGTPMKRNSNIGKLTYNPIRLNVLNLNNDNKRSPRM